MPKIHSPRWMEPITIKANYVLPGGLEIIRKTRLPSDADVNFHKSQAKGDTVCFSLKLFISTWGSRRKKMIVYEYQNVFIYDVFFVL